MTPAPRPQPAPPTDAKARRRRRVIEVLARLVLAAQAADRVDRPEQAQKSEAV